MQQADTPAMQYRELPDGTRISTLGLGCMRFPRSKTGHPDQKAVDAIIERALERGINYLDTAWIYPGSEVAVGKALSKLDAHGRAMIASKLPHALCKKTADFDRYLDGSLKRLQRDQIEFYLVHNVNNWEQWERLSALGLPEWLQKQRASGKCQRIGFSYHGPVGDFLKLLSAFNWDFCQIQYNYAGERVQAGTRGLMAAAEAVIPVFIMEPLLGGRLADKLSKPAKRIFTHADEAMSRTPLSPAAWGLRWLWDKPQVTMVLSGMNTVEMIDENCDTACAAPVHCMSAAEHEAIAAVVAKFERSNRVNCTGCGYCMPCPRGVYIPGSFSAYNASYSHGWFTGIWQYYTGSALRSGNPKLVSLCTECGACVRKCPQHIDIPSELKNVRKRFQPGPVTPVLNAIAKKS